MSKIAIIGGGAAGFFTAINIAERKPNAEITIYEGSNKLLSKVLISGGGRCNVTNEEFRPKELAKHYPRGHNELVTVFEKFNSKDCWNWFEERGVPLKVEEDGRVFPRSNSSKSIYNCLTQTAKKLGIVVKLAHRLKDFKRNDNGWLLSFDEHELLADKLVFCTGGSKQIWAMLDNKGISIEGSCPSLFTFNAKHTVLQELSGVSTETAAVSVINGQKQYGPLLITHAGFSGPSVLKLSAWEARTMAQMNYQFKLSINWNTSLDQTRFIQLLREKTTQTPKERVRNFKEHGLAKRLYSAICDAANISEYTNWSEIGKKGIARLCKALFDFEVEITSKSTFKEEFVNCGGVKLSSIDLQTFESKEQTDLYFAGEVLNIDAETGGYNFQAAWSTAYLVSQAV